MSVLFANQNFSELKRNCIVSRKFFVDDKFPTSVVPRSNYTWMRPGDICHNPKFFVNGCSRFDTNQGRLGDCWLIAAMANLTQHPKLFSQVVCDDNGDFDFGNCGIFHFRFWHNGKWNDVVVDDFLPTRDGKLVFVHSTDSNEFWSALLEKAYAKLYGGYDQLVGGRSRDASSEFTGGVTETYSLKKPHPKLYQMMLKSFNRHSLMDCAIKDPSKERLGLVSGHAYSITKVTTITFRNEIVQLLRIRNPWGNHSEWRGAWSDKSNEWKHASTAEKLRVKFEDKPNGEFYMSFEDFLMYFDQLSICNLTPDMLNREPRMDREWKTATFKGKWEKSENFGFSLTLVDPDLDDDEDFCTIVVSVLKIQQHRTDYQRLGIKIYSQSLELVRYQLSESVSRESVFRFDLAPGQYVFAPHSDKSFEYFIRVFYEIKKKDFQQYASFYPRLEEISLSEMVPASSTPPTARVPGRPQKKKNKSKCIIC